MRKSSPVEVAQQVAPARAPLGDQDKNAAFAANASTPQENSDRAKEQGLEKEEEKESKPEGLPKKRRRKRKSESTEQKGEGKKKKKKKRYEGRISSQHKREEDGSHYGGEELQEELGGALNEMMAALGNNNKKKDEEGVKEKKGGMVRIELPAVPGEEVGREEIERKKEGDFCREVEEELRKIMGKMVASKGGGGRRMRVRVGVQLLDHGGYEDTRDNFELSAILAETEEVKEVEEATPGFTYRCNYCSFSCPLSESRLSEIVEHISTGFSPATSPNGNIRLPALLRRCRQRVRLTIAGDSVSASVSLMCRDKKCGKEEFKSPEDLLRHYRDRHKSEVDRRKCLICETGLAGQSLEGHLRAREGEHRRRIGALVAVGCREKMARESKVCSMCGESYERPPALPMWMEVEKCADCLMKNSRIAEDQDPMREIEKCEVCRQKKHSNPPSPCCPDCSGLLASAASASAGGEGREECDQYVRKMLLDMVRARFYFCPPKKGMGGESLSKVFLRGVGRGRSARVSLNFPHSFSLPLFSTLPFVR